MSTGSAITSWLSHLKEGDVAAAQALWERYYARLVALAKMKLRGVARRAADEEDVALSAINSFVEGARLKRFPQLADRQDLWALLVTITARKAINLRNHAGRKKRGGGAVRGESVFLRGPHDPEAAGIEQIVGHAPTPEFTVQLLEEFQQRLDQLDESQWRQIAIWKLEGYTSEEIAKRLDCSLTSVERKLRLIRKAWERDLPG
jgi:DNA-directed RNA polymerase specialized sigma24 family protein